MSFDDFAYLVKSQATTSPIPGILSTEKRLQHMRDIVFTNSDSVIANFRDDGTAIIKSADHDFALCLVGELDSIVQQIKQSDKEKIIIALNSGQWKRPGRQVDLELTASGGWRCGELRPMPVG